MTGILSFHSGRVFVYVYVHMCVYEDLCIFGVDERPDEVANLGLPLSQFVVLYLHRHTFLCHLTHVFCWSSIIVIAAPSHLHGVAAQD